MQKVDVNDTNGEFDNNTKESEINHLDEQAENQKIVDDTLLLNNNFSSHETEGFVDDNNGEGSTEILDDDIFEELPQEGFFAHENISPENSDSCVSTLAFWSYLFIALWQKKFNITDRAVEFLVKFLALFVKVYSGEDLNNSDRKSFLEKYLALYIC